jgi:hypothetical protein
MSALGEGRRKIGRQDHFANMASNFSAASICKLGITWL